MGLNHLNEIVFSEHRGMIIANYGIMRSGKTEGLRDLLYFRQRVRKHPSRCFVPASHTRGLNDRDLERGWTFLKTAADVSSKDGVECIRNIDDVLEGISRGELPKDIFPAYIVDKPYEIVKLLEKDDAKVKASSSSNTHVMYVGIDELAYFSPDIIEVIMYLRYDSANPRIVIPSGISKDFVQRDFGPMADIMSIADIRVQSNPPPCCGLNKYGRCDNNAQFDARLLNIEKTSFEGDEVIAVGKDDIELRGFTSAALFDLPQRVEIELKPGQTEQDSSFVYVQFCNNCLPPIPYASETLRVRGDIEALLVSRGAITPDRAVPIGEVYSLIKTAHPELEPHINDFTMWLPTSGILTCDEGAYLEICTRGSLPGLYKTLDPETFKLLNEESCSDSKIPERVRVIDTVESEQQ